MRKYGIYKIISRQLIDIVRAETENAAISQYAKKHLDKAQIHEGSKTTLAFATGYTKSGEFVELCARRKR